MGMAVVFKSPSAYTTALTKRLEGQTQDTGLVQSQQPALGLAAKTKSGLGQAAIAAAISPHNYTTTTHNPH